MVINGTLCTGGTSFIGNFSVYDGDVTGSGALQINYGGYISVVAHSITGLSSITLTAATLSAGQDITGIGTITAADQTSITAGDNLAGVGNVTIGSSAANATGASLTDGWWAIERDDASVWRWTNRDAARPIRSGRVMVEIVVAETVPYPVTGTGRSRRPTATWQPVAA